MEQLKGKLFPDLPVNANDVSLKTESSPLDESQADLCTAALQCQISFSYMEILGKDAKDCLTDIESVDSYDAGAEILKKEHEEVDQAKPSTQVQIGEMLDGRISINNLSDHMVANADEFSLLIEKAKAKRLTKQTERNAESSRSHGIGIISIHYPQRPGSRPG